MALGRFMASTLQGEEVGTGKKIRAEIWVVGNRHVWRRSCELSSRRWIWGVELQHPAGCGVSKKVQGGVIEKKVEAAVLESVEDEA